jgi:hypothetical protein
VSKKKPLTKKELKRLSREKAKREVKAREESVGWEARIKVLLGEVRRKKSKVRELVKRNQLVASLVELVGKQGDLIEHLMKFRAEWERVHAHYPSELENLVRASLHAEIEALVDKLIKTGAIKFTPRQKSEAKRKTIFGVGLIERQFGNVISFCFCPPTCLDGIFRGGSVTLGELEELFGVIRQRFPGDLGKLRHDGGRYNHDAVVLIMDALLSEDRVDRGKLERGKKIGRPRRPWLIDPKDPGLRERVSSRIEARLENLPQVSENVARAFQGVVHPHLALIREKNPV